MSKASNAPSAEPTTVEVWRAIPDWPYEVSSLGRVRRIGTERIRKNNKGRHGYEYVDLWVGERRRFFRVAALVASAFIGPRPVGLQINHRNGTKTDNRAENLEYVTPRENIRHAKRTGLAPTLYGENTSGARLNHLQVRVIRRLKGLPHLFIAGVFGIARNTVYLIQSGRRWPPDAALAAFAKAKESKNA